MNFYTIPATLPFADTLAKTCEDMAERRNIPLSSFKIFLPTRRGIRTLQEAFLNLSQGKPRLLPVMQSIGDADLEELSFSASAYPDILPAIDPMRRQMALAKLLKGVWPHDYNYQQALSIASELGRLIDQIHTENLDPSKLADLKDVHDYAAHWEITTRFLLMVLNDLWPAVLSEEGVIDPGLHRRERITALTRYYRNQPPATPVIVAGSTGSIPATREFIRTIASLENGMAILPALDTLMDSKSWSKVGDGHPQHLLKKLLLDCKIGRKDVSVIEQPRNAERHKIATEMMRPAETTEEWQELATNEKDAVLKGLNGVTICEAENDHHEATVIALAMLEVAADPMQQKTATLITPDRYLAMRVQAALRQWGIEIDDSGGTSLTNTALGQFCLTVIQAYQNNQLCPVPFLSCAKNPFAGGGAVPNYRNAVRALEKDVFRGVRPYGDFKLIAERNPRQADILDAFADIFTPLKPYQSGHHALRALISAHLQVMEALASTAEMSGAERLWSGDDGEALASFFATLQQNADVTPPVTLSDYAEMVHGFLKTQTFTATYGKHPRLSILGQIEARMVSADRVILSGLNEGVWPPESGFDTWMSRKMRADFGLPSLEQKTTLAAHDFMTAFCAPEVFITRSKKSGGQPTLTSRWLNRLQTVMQAADIREEDWPHTRGLVYARWAEEIRLRLADYSPCDRPAPCPPLERRPKTFTVTEIEKWMRDPYWIYAKKILKLKALEPVDMEVGAADRGTLIHDTLETFTKRFNRDLPTDALNTLIDIGRKEFAAHAQNPEIHGFWWPRFTRAATWFIEKETEWRSLTSFITSEITGTLTQVIDGVSYELKGKADRIESRQDGSYAIIDYKTGSAPQPGDVNSGLTSQLPLEAWILQEGGYDTIRPRSEAPIDLYYWSLGGSGDGGEAKLAQGTGKKAPETAQLLEEAKEGLCALLTSFHNSETAYIASPDPTRKIRTEYNDYAHLERIAEWSVSTDEGEAA